MKSIKLSGVLTVENHDGKNVTVLTKGPIRITFEEFNEGLGGYTTPYALTPFLNKPVEIIVSERNVNLKIQEV